MSDIKYFTKKSYKGIIEITAKLANIINTIINPLICSHRGYNNAAYINNTKKELYATDGECLIIIKTNIRSATGYYIPVEHNGNNMLIPYNSNDAYPVISFITNGYDKEQNLFNTNIRCDNDTRENSITIFKILQKINNPIDIKYFEVLKYIGEFNAKHIAGKAVLFYNDTVQCYIMPLKKY